MKRLLAFGICIVFLAVMGQLAVAQRWPSGNWETAIVVTNDQVHEKEASVEQEGSVFTIKAGGDDIWGSADQFLYVYKTVKGDFDVTATVQSLEQTNDWSKAGIMARQDISPGSVNILSYSRGANDYVMLQRRDVADGNSTSQRMTSDGGVRPVTVRLIRKGNEFTGGWSLDGGKTWEKNVQPDGTTTLPVTLAMTDPILLGIAVTSHVAGTLTTAEVEILNDPSAVRPAQKLAITWGAVKAKH